MGSPSPYHNDESIEGYPPVVQALMTVFSEMSDQLSTPEMVAEVIWEAATDGSDRMRYIAGADAEQIIGLRKTADDPTSMAAIGQMMGMPTG